MSITTTVGTPTLCSVGVNNIVFDAGASPKALVVTVVAGGTPGLSGLAVSAMTWNGVALTRKAGAHYGVLGDMTSEVWVSDGFTPASGSNTLAVTANYACHVTVMAMASGGTVTYDSSTQYAGDIGHSTWSADSGADHGVIVIAHTSNGAATLTPGAGFTEDLDTSHGGDAVASGHEDPSAIGSRSVGWSGGATKCTMSAVLMVAGEPIAIPTRFGVEVGFTAGAAIGLTGPQYILGARIRPLEVGFRAGLRMGGTAKRQVALVGPDDAPRLFTPEMTEGGDEGDILTQHADSPPTWEAKTHYEPVRFDTDGDGVADDWLYHTDGDVVMLEVEN